MRVLVCAILLCLMALPARAELITPQPQCAYVLNDTGSYLFASIRTEYGTTATGEKKRHESSFRLDAGERKKACSTGPFYPGYQIELVVKTMIPVFSCKTRLTGTIIISAKRDEQGINRISAACKR